MADKQFRVSIPLRVLDQLRGWATLANDLQLRESYIDDLKNLSHLLKSVPESWGDPLFDWDAAELVVYRGFTEYIRVFHAVHVGTSNVFVREVELRPDRHLGQAKQD